MSYTTADLLSYCYASGWRDESSGGATQCKAFINDMIQRLASSKNWPCYRKFYALSLSAPYETGTVTVTNGSATVTGSGTAWVAGMVGQEFYCSDDTSRIYEVATVASGTSLTLTQTYLGTGGASKTYEIRYVRYSLPSDWDRPYGILTDQSGNKINEPQARLDEWQDLRINGKGTASLPTDIAISRGGPGQASTCYMYVHPAPSASRQLRGAYQATPVTATDATAPDWPERYRYLLHKLLRAEISVQDSRPVDSIAEHMALIEEAYQRDVQEHGPVIISVGRGKSVFDEVSAVKSRINLIDS